MDRQIAINSKRKSDMSSSWNNVKKRFCEESDWWPETLPLPSPPSMSYYYIHMVTFYEEDMVPFLLKIS
jgi:hypothetical protein